MRKFYILTFNSQDESTMKIVDHDPHELDRFLFREKGNVVLPNDLKLFADNGEHTDLLANSLGWKIVSEKFRSLMGGECNNVKFIKAPIYSKNDGSEIDGYYFLNVLNSFDCLDEKGSDIRYFKSGHRMGIFKYSIYDNEIPSDTNVFGIETCNDVFFSDVVTDNFKGKELKGVTFIKTITS